MKLKRKFKAIEKEKLFKILGLVVFFYIVFSVFCKVTYLFRNAVYDRLHIIGIENEKLDMVYVGGSAAFVYWQPLKAWNDCGFTSYNYATNSVLAENIMAYIQEVRTTQDPDLFVVDVRPFQYFIDDSNEAGLRNGTDAMNITSLARYNLINRYFKIRNVTDDIDKLSYYIDIVKYHTNTQNLGNGTAWLMSDNNFDVVLKGWEWMDSYAYLDDPKDFDTEECAELSNNNVAILKELLQYCKDEQLNVLFVVCPYYITIEDQAKYNTIGHIVESYGFRFLNTNNHYDEMGIDFSQDFYNRNHVNLFGAEKYTDYLENYIVSNYKLSDHRGDAEYESWNEDYQLFKGEYGIHEANVTNIRLDVEKGIEIEKQMLAAKSFWEWYELANDHRYTLLIAAANPIGNVSNIAFEKVLTKWSMCGDVPSQIRVIQDSTITYSNASDQALAYDGAAGIWCDIPYQIVIEDGNNVISIANKEVLNDSEGIKIVVFDNNYRRVADIVTIQMSGDEIYISRD